jgi:hypothetical protein
MLKWVEVSRDDPSLQKILKRLECEHNNSFPLGWREITPLEFARSKFGTYTPDFEQNRQMHPAKDEKRQDFLTYNSYRKIYEPQALCATLYYFWDGTGLAIQTSYYNTEKPLRFFAFGCDHNYREMGDDESRSRGYSVGRCLHTTECRKCKHVFAYDSSD